MYSFYEKMEQEIDLKDLSEYLIDPLNHINLLEIKLQSLSKKEKNMNVIVLNDLLRECKKITDDLLPELIENYCQLSLDFRNTVTIKEYNNSCGEKIRLTSKDLLLKNCGKIIEHIKLLEEQFYKEYSFDFLVNSRIISELGYQKEFLEEDRAEISLENKYKFNQDDADDLVIKELERNGQGRLKLEKNESRTKSQLVFNLAPVIEEDNLEFLEKKEVNNEVVMEDVSQISNKKETFFVGFFVAALLAIFVLLEFAYNIPSNSNNTNIAPVAQQRVINEAEELRKMDENTKEFIKNLNSNNQLSSNDILKQQNELKKMDENTKNMLEKIKETKDNSRVVFNVNEQFRNVPQTTEVMKMKEATEMFLKNNK